MNKIMGPDLCCGMHFWEMGSEFQIDSVWYDTAWTGPGGKHRYAVIAHWVGGTPVQPIYNYNYRASLREDFPWKITITHACRTSGCRCTELTHIHKFTHDEYCSICAAKINNIIPGTIIAK